MLSLLVLTILFCGLTLAVCSGDRTCFKLNSVPCWVFLCMGSNVQGRSLLVVTGRPVSDVRFDSDICLSDS